MFIYILIVLISAAVGLGISATVLKGKNLFNFNKRKEQAEELLERAKTESGALLREAKLKTAEAEKRLEEDVLAGETRVNKVKSVLGNREALLKKKEDRINERRLQLAGLEEETQSRKDELRRLEESEMVKLTSKTGQNIETLKKEVVNKYTKEIELTANDRLLKTEEDLRENAPKTAKRILQNVMQRLSSPTSVESKSVLIKVPKDPIKGKIVGKDGKNILELESLLEVDVVFNDLPNTISVASYNLVNRRTAEIAIRKLIKIHGEIHPKIVRQTLEDAKKDVEKELYEIGKAALQKMGIKNTNPELIKIIGRLQFRTSYGQNIMKHSMEVAWVATMLGSEIGLDVQTCKVAAFLHDLGKAIDQDPSIQESHDVLTKELMEKYGFSDAEVHAAWTHHEAEKPETPEALMVMAADAVSAGRPGARQESLDKYIQRIRALEETGSSYEGVSKSFAISAGRELRVIVDPERIKDEGMKALAGDIAGNIEESLSYPGKIKVNIIRRTTHIETAK